MPKFPSQGYNRLSTLWPTRQYVGMGSQVQGEGTSHAMSITETWEVGGTANFGDGTTNPTLNTKMVGGAKSIQRVFCDVVQQTLGYPVSNGPNGGITRNGPNAGGGSPIAKHPDISNLYATRISNVQGIGSSGVGLMNSAAWKVVRFDVTFETLPFQPLSNAAAAALGARDPVPNPGEQYRFLIPSYHSACEILQVPGGTFQYPTAAPVKGNPPAIPHSKGASLRLLKRSYTYTWVSVPDVGLFSGLGSFFGGSATNIEAGLGCVNADTFLGFAPGTLLLESWKPVPRAYPTYGDQDFKRSRIWDVQLKFTYFPTPVNPADPAKNTSITIVAGGKQQVYNVGTGGHNCVPASDGYWYRVFLKVKGPPQSDDSGGPQVNGIHSQIWWKYKYYPFWALFVMSA